eukprot:7045196-Alexandrium_andersonii.AAC.1
MSGYRAKRVACEHASRERGCAFRAGPLRFPCRAIALSVPGHCAFRAGLLRFLCRLLCGFARDLLVAQLPQ